MKRALLVLIAVSLSAAAAPPAAKPASQRVVRVPLTVVSSGESAPLAPAQLTAMVDTRTKARIVRVRSPKDDLLLIVVMDVAGDLALVDPARYALVEQFRNPPAKMQVALMRAQDGLRVLLDPTNDAAALEKAILEMPVAGRAGLLESVETAAMLSDSISNKTGVRVAVLYLTDSDVRNYREDFTNPVINSSDSRDLSRRFPEGLVREKISKIKQSLLGYQSPVFVVHLRYASERLNEAYQSGLLDLATVTGGAAIFCRSSAEIPQSIARMLADIASQYQVTVQLPAKVPRMLNLTMSSEERSLLYRSLFVMR